MEKVYSEDMVFVFKDDGGSSGQTQHFGGGYEGSPGQSSFTFYK